MSHKKRGENEVAEVDSLDQAIAASQEALAERREKSLTRKNWSPEARQAFSEKLRAVYSDPERRKALREKLRASWTLEAKARHSAKMREVLSNPEVRARMKEGLERFWSEFLQVRKEMNP